MNDSAQLFLFDLGPALPTAAQVEADRCAQIVAKVDADADMGLLGGDDYEPDFGDE